MSRLQIGCRGLYFSPQRNLQTTVGLRKHLTHHRQQADCLSASIIGRSFLLPPCNLSLDELRHGFVQVLMLQDANEFGIGQGRDGNSDFAVSWHVQFLSGQLLADDIGIA
jgi:hypothetical protein